MLKAALEKEKLEKQRLAQQVVETKR